MIQENGRSMVEMLGILAIIGIISVTSITAFKTAMNHHRANELLNEASKRASILAMQLASGRSLEELSLAEFSNNDLGYAKFKNSVTRGINIKQFNIELESAPDSNICQNMKDMVGKNTSIRSINENCTQITFNPDLSINDGIDLGSCEAENTVYLSYNTNPCTVTINADVSCTQNSDCGNPNWGACCMNGKCTAGLGSSICTDIQGKCVKNSDCSAGYFCNLIGNTTGPLQGACVPLDTAVEKPAKDTIIGKITYQAKSFIMYKNAISYWGAQNWCAAHGMRMATLADLSLGIPTNEDLTLEDIYGNIFTDEELTNFKNAFNCCFWTDTSTSPESSKAIYNNKITGWSKNSGMRALCIKK